VRAYVTGRPGPKGSVTPYCVRCANRRLPQNIAVREQSKVGEVWRKVITKALRPPKAQAQPRTIQTRTTAMIYIDRKRQVRGGVELESYVPSSMTAAPLHQGTGDIEKHVRTLHDALQDALVLANDSIVTTLVVGKRWADEQHPAGVEILIEDDPLDQLLP
jgi:Holliday junction resolvase RusA-like endonuclease